MESRLTISLGKLRPQSVKIAIVLSSNQRTTFGKGMRRPFFESFAFFLSHLGPSLKLLNSCILTRILLQLLPLFPKSIIQVNTRSKRANNGGYESGNDKCFLAINESVSGSITYSQTHSKTVSKELAC